MNKKIYFNNHYILLSSCQIQPSANQLIVNVSEEKKETLTKIIQDFIQQNNTKDLILICKDVNSFFDEIKQQFKYIEAAGGLISNEDRYLFIYRLDKWDLPKGKIDKGETPEQAAIRECEEECGITGITITGQLPSTYHIYQFKGAYVLKTTFWFSMNTTHKGKLSPQIEENIEKVEWLDSKTIKEIVIKNTYPSVLELILVTINN